MLMTTCLRTGPLGVAGGLWLALGLLACEQPASPFVTNAPAAGVAVPSGSASGVGANPVVPGPRSGMPLVVSSELSVAGLGVRSGSIARSTLWGFSELSVDLKRARLEIALDSRGAPLNRLLPPGALAVVNGGYFESDFRPSTWLRSQGRDLAPRTDTSKGGVLALKGDQLFVGPFSGLSWQPELAIQSFPLIVEPNGRPGVRRDDGRRAARTVACLAEGALRFIVIAAPRGDGPTLFESVALLRDPPPRGFGCRVALNLDGGPSAGVWFGPEVAAKQRLPLAPVAYAIAIVPEDTSKQGAGTLK